jgi:AcrR family transcriptional regulator
MARKTTRRHEQGEASRRTILDATLRIAGERGYVGTTMAQVTKASGLPASSVYWHFKNKDELLADSLEHGFQLWDSVAPRWTDVDPTQPRVDALLDQLRAVTRGLEEEPGFWRMGLLIALETGPAVGTHPRERFLDVRRAALARLTDWWSRSLASDGDAVDPAQARVLALLTLVSMDGVFLAHQSDSDLDLDPTLRVLAHGLDAAARAVASGELGASASHPRRRSATAAPAVKLVATEPDSGRARLLAAAAEVAAESGYEGATISRICERAGLPASSIYWHFDDKDDLLAAVIEHSYQEWYVAQPAWLPPEPGTSWTEELRSHFSVSLRSLSERPLFLRMGHLLLLLRRDDPPAARAMFVTVRHRAQVVTEEWYADVLGPDGDPELPGAMSLLTMVLSDGLFFSNQLDVPTWDSELFTDLVVTMLGAATTASRPAATA